MLNAVKSDRPLQAALGLMAALGLVYAFHALALIGADYRALSEQEHRDWVAARHEAVCRQLGKLPSSPEHRHCMGLLDELRGWHEHALAQQNDSIL